VGGGRGGVSVPLIFVSRFQVLVLIALGQAFGESGLLQDLCGSGSGQPDRCRRVGLGLSECVGQSFLVGNCRGEGTLEGLGIVDNFRLNPDAGVCGWENLDVGLGDNVREGFFEGVGLSQSLRLNRNTGAGDGNRQRLSIGDVEGIRLDVGLSHGVVDRGWDGLRVSDREGLGLNRLVSNGHG